MSREHGTDPGDRAIDPSLCDGFGDAAAPDYADLRAALLQSLRPDPPQQDRVLALRTRVLDAALGPYRIIRGAEVAFRPLIPGVAIKPLRVDRGGNTQTSLWRLDPGSAIPAHSHSAEEECMVLEGEILWGGSAYGPGDFLVARPGAHHEPFLSPRGALLMIRSEMTPFLAKVFDGVAG